MRNEGEGAHEEEQDGRAVLRVPVQLPGDAHQSQEAGRFQQPYQGGGLVGVGEAEVRR